MADIVVNTDSLKSYASRLSSVNRRISQLDWRMNSLYFKVGFLDLFNLIQADLLTGYSYRLNRCANYLNQTASDFEAVENDLSGKDPSKFIGILLPTATGVAFTETESEDEEEEHSTFAKFFTNQLKKSGSLIPGETSGEGEFLGISAAGSASGDILYYELGIKNKVGWKFKDKDGNWDFKSFGISSEAKATGAIARGEVEGNYGYLHGKLEGSFLTAAISGEAKATLWDDGKFNPSLFVGAKAEGSVLKGKAEAGFGTDQYGIYGKADGDLLHAEAEAKAGIGYIGTDEDGKAMYGASAKASAMASAAQGSVKGGITIFGIDIDVGVKGYAGAAGAEVGGYITTNGVSGSLSGALGLGVGLDISIDWSDAEWISDTIDAVGDFADDAVDFISDVGETIYDGATAFAEGIAQGAEDFAEGFVDTMEDVGDFLFGWL